MSFVRFFPSFVTVKQSSEKVHETSPTDIVGSFEFTVLQRNLKEWHERPWTYVCES